MPKFVRDYVEVFDENGSEGITPEIQYIQDRTRDIMEFGGWIIFMVCCIIIIGLVLYRLRQGKTYFENAGGLQTKDSPMVKQKQKRSE